MNSLGRRLAAVAELIPYGVHVDIGSDHAYLLRWLLRTESIERGIAIEKTPPPYENSRRTLAGLNAEVRLADGFEGLVQGEANSVSLCGMGGRLVTNLLEAYPERVPCCVIVAANDHTDSVRRWAIRSGYQLVDEAFVMDRHPYMMMRFDRYHDADAASGCVDPAYAQIDQDVALHFGPLLIRKRDPEFVDYLHRDLRRLSELPKLTAESAKRLEMLESLIDPNEQS
ncbi:tRNA (adenine(22)-N(1))-methyltransferase [Rhodopirellula sp. MGV]|uniref:tRNA (adenine(22)-N(1))-methyltransferase n=1 Tax=Rhodopirellula sp. MGV TaxID=2023130 RepID=UPI00130414D8|nr:tRNA (adenine(22)-N(1))-methyltransferase TrmK [Rhodopirellula sp. MGV]